MKYYPSGFRASLCLLYALFWVCIVQSEPSAAVRVSIDRRGGFTLRLSCKQGHPETMADPAPHIPKYLIHPFKRPRANFSAAACWIPNKSTGPKALNRAMKTRMQVAGVEFSAIHTFQTSQTKHTHTHTSLLPLSLASQRRFAGRKKALGSGGLLFPDTFAWGRRVCFVYGTTQCYH